MQSKFNTKRTAGDVGPYGFVNHTAEYLSNSALCIFMRSFDFGRCPPLRMTYCGRRNASPTARCTLHSALYLLCTFPIGAYLKISSPSRCSFQRRAEYIVLLSYLLQ